MSSSPSTNGFGAAPGPQPNGERNKVKKSELNATKQSPKENVKPKHLKKEKSSAGIMSILKKKHADSEFKVKKKRRHPDGKSPSKSEKRKPKMHTPPGSNDAHGDGRAEPHPNGDTDTCKKTNGAKAEAATNNGQGQPGLTDATTLPAAGSTPKDAVAVPLQQPYVAEHELKDLKVAVEDVLRYGGMLTERHHGKLGRAMEALKAKMEE